MPLASPRSICRAGALRSACAGCRDSALRCHMPASTSSPLSGHVSPPVHDTGKEGLVSPAGGHRGGALHSRSFHEPLENN